MPNNLIKAAAIIILFMPTILTFHFKEEALNLFSKLENYENSMSTFIGYEQIHDSKFIKPSRSEEIKAVRFTKTNDQP